MILHTINNSNYKLLSACLRTALAKDSILLIENGVNAAIKTTSTSKQLMENKQLTIYVLSEDIEKYGIRDNIISECQVIDYNGFVRLSINNKQVQSWY